MLLVALWWLYIVAIGLSSLVVVVFVFVVVLLVGCL